MYAAVPRINPACVTAGLVMVGESDASFAVAAGSSAFAKVGMTAETSDWLHAEQIFYSKVRADFMPALIGWSDDRERPLLLLEDLSAAHWPRNPCPSSSLSGYPFPRSLP